MPPLPGPSRAAVNQSRLRRRRAEDPAPEPDEAPPPAPDLSAWCPACDRDILPGEDVVHRPHMSYHARCWKEIHGPGADDYGYDLRTPQAAARPQPHRERGAQP